jgi:hypothetical protein
MTCPDGLAGGLVGSYWSGTFITIYGRSAYISWQGAYTVELILISYTMSPS